jgi:gliding motility associated protien GldN
MKRQILKFAALMSLVILFASTVDAQGRPRKKKKINTQKKKPNTPDPNANAGITTPPPVVNDSLPIAKGKPTLRSNTGAAENMIKDRNALPYDHIREEDKLYSQIVWREIDTREKMNLPFRYSAQDDRGDQRFISILLTGLQNDEYIAFKDDGFREPTTKAEITGLLSGAPQIIQVPDWAKDPTGGTMKDSTITNDFNADLVVAYRMKEEWIFDREASRLVCRILGIAPLKVIKNDDGSERGKTPLFWVYYPDTRMTLNKSRAFNGKNFAGRMTWEEIFEGRFFSSFITKSTLNNPFDQNIKEYVNDPILRLLTGEEVKETIFNFEQDVWSY